MKNRVTVRIGAAYDDVTSSVFGRIDRAAAKRGKNGADRRDIDTAVAEAICEHVGIKHKRADRRARNQKYKQRRNND